MEVILGIVAALSLLFAGFKNYQAKKARRKLFDERVSSYDEDVDRATEEVKKKGDIYEKLKKKYDWNSDSSDT